MPKSTGRSSVRTGPARKPSGLTSLPHQGIHYINRNLIYKLYGLIKQLTGCIFRHRKTFCTGFHIDCHGVLVHLIQILYFNAKYPCKAALNLTYYKIS